MCLKENRDTLSLGVGHLRKLISGRIKETEKRGQVEEEREGLSDKDRERKKKDEEGDKKN